VTAHKNRAGALLISYDCKQSRHGDECGKDMREMGIDSPIHCHCICHPDDGCVPTIRRRPKRVRICSKCYLDHPEGTECP